MIFMSLMISTMMTKKSCITFMSKLNVRKKVRHVLIQNFWQMGSHSYDVFIPRLNKDQGI